MTLQIDDRHLAYPIKFGTSVLLFA
ncbi:hypothetical protein BOS5A_10037 [Bosea sp. EC-HK365B]|nr:hypothetical protein BOSE7B_150103 [Bosea sp. 7B]VVT43451.1 hypothetical protein BOS5A_10037 [Bosea sp. EC-HK365B]VXC31113.1 hypothetical protein BOSE127_180104 [Bosea sp. 127]